MSKWFPYSKSQGGSKGKICVFGFPHSGGGASIFKAWNEYLPENIEFIPVQFPGRETRIREEFITDMDTLSSKIVEAILEYYSGPIGLFGHSLGGAVAFDVGRKLERLERSPLRIFISACSFPSPENRQSSLHQLDEQALLDNLRDYRGTPAEIIENKELLSFVLPRIRADFKVFETFVLEKNFPQNFSISVFFGEDDNIAKAEKMKEWQQASVSPVSIDMIEGDHFFHIYSGKKICEHIQQHLSLSKPLMREQRK